MMSWSCSNREGHPMCVKNSFWETKSSFRSENLLLKPDFDFFRFFKKMFLYSLVSCNRCPETQKTSPNHCHIILESFGQFWNEEIKKKCFQNRILVDFLLLSCFFESNYLDVSCRLLFIPTPSSKSALKNSTFHLKSKTCLKDQENQKCREGHMS